MTLQQFLLILRARASDRLYVFPSAPCWTTLVVSLISCQSQLTASTAVVIDVKSPDPVAGMVLPGLPDARLHGHPGRHHQQRPRRPARGQVLKLDENPAIKGAVAGRREGKGSLTVWLGNLLQKKLDVKPSRESNVVIINFSGADPGFAAAIANAFARAYVDVNSNTGRARAPVRRLVRRTGTPAPRQAPEAAQAALRLQQRTGIVATDDASTETAKLDKFPPHLPSPRADRRQRQQAKSAGGSETLVEVMQNPLINQLKADLARLEKPNGGKPASSPAEPPADAAHRIRIASLKERSPSKRAR